ncbi:MAG: hypothetical protein ABJ311_08905 [Erythrobacter sp.]
MFTISQLFSPQNTAKSGSFVFWFLAPWARVSASCMAEGIRNLVPEIKRRVTGH